MARDTQRHIRQLGNPDFLLCRTLGHEWEPFTPIDMQRPRWGIRLSLLCVRCGMERHDIVDSLGQVASRSYDQPNGYSMAHLEAPDRPGKSDYRLVLARDIGTRGPTLSRPLNEEEQ